MSNVEIYLDKYKVLEDVIRKKYNINSYNESPVAKIENMQEYKNIKERLRYIRELRNILVHKLKFNDEYPLEVKDLILKEMDSLINFIEHPPTVYDKCIKLNDICYAKWNDLIYPIMLKMKENVYTHIPILNNGVVEAVFSENTLFGALIEDELVYEKDKTMFKDELIRKYSLIQNHITETFRFVNRDCELSKAKELFNNALVNNERLAMLFITNSGKPTEKLLGILTIWDIL